MSSHSDNSKRNIEGHQIKISGAPPYFFANLLNTPVNCIISPISDILIFPDMKAASGFSLPNSISLYVPSETETTHFASPLNHGSTLHRPFLIITFKGKNSSTERKAHDSYFPDLLNRGSAEKV